MPWYASELKYSELKWPSFWSFIMFTVTASQNSNSVCKTFSFVFCDFPWLWNMVCYSERRTQINKKYIQNFGMRKPALEYGLEF